MNAPKRQGASQATQWPELERVPDGQTSVQDAACLVVFCKRPAMFQGKQRLAQSTGAGQALAFARALLGCALEDASAWSGPVVLSPACADDAHWAQTLLTRDCQVLAQPDGGLGSRLSRVDRALRDQGHAKIIFIGTDAPALLPEHFCQAQAALREADIVLSASSDGGVTIMGARTPWPDLAPLPWSTRDLDAALTRLCKEHRLSVTHIAPSYDVDVEADLHRLMTDLSGDGRPARQRLYQQLSTFLSQEIISNA